MARPENDKNYTLQTKFLHKNASPMQRLKILLISIICLFFVLFGLVRLINFYPDEIQAQKVTCTLEAPLVKKNQEIKVMNWNVQYMAGRNYVFYYETADGQDSRPSTQDINITTKRVSKIIELEDPDIILMQEVDDGAARTDYEDQAMKLIKKMSPNKYPCRAEAFYWKSSYIPHPEIMGSVGMKLVTFSKYKITESYRHRLPQIPQSWLEKQFDLKRGVLEVRLPYEDQKKNYFYVMNTHLSAFAQGTDNMEQQVNKILALLSDLDSEQAQWIIGGDFNLLSVSAQRENLSFASHKKSYRKDTELKPLIDKYQMVPTLEEVGGEKMNDWFTYSPNTKKKKKWVDRTIDYLFLSNNIKLDRHYVRFKETIDVSDHMPMVSFLKL